MGACSFSSARARIWRAIRAIRKWICSAVSGFAHRPPVLRRHSETGEGRAVAGGASFACARLADDGWRPSWLAACGTILDSNSHLQLVDLYVRFWATSRRKALEPLIFFGG